eukprot:gnl/TRDRNA2_/TRDRNA2_58602_c0_seq1.p1 gnl/TRDRNA2_/TRDRNA2_58602_c0~~gnl/TRDRNA2_/TRDRNA2_58602_c0_seq1.p1  ORF type:complete len:192 (-),score=21.90 gnl/TRDRNA2_/TRDRNA2_58602_c0_seq1:14-589(-)
MEPAKAYNRYMDWCVHYTYMNLTRIVRFVAAEDETYASNRPSSFNVVIKELKDDGRPLQRDYIGKNMAPNEAGHILDQEGFAWASHTLITVVVAAIIDYKWPECSPRGQHSSADVLQEDVADISDIEAAVRSAVFASGIPRTWIVKFGFTRINGRCGVRFYVEYAHCSHMMRLPIIVEERVPRSWWPSAGV